MATENISTGNFYRILKDKATSTWDRISFWTHASDVELSSGTSLETDLNNKTTQIEGIQSDFAQIESTSVSSHVYTKGMMLVYNGQLYRVTSAIAQGETLVVGTNIEIASVGTLANMLTASNGNQFYLDVKDDKYGFYPSASKVSEEFVPFGGSSFDPALLYVTHYTGSGYIFDQWFAPNHKYIVVWHNHNQAYTMYYELTNMTLIQESRSNVSTFVMSIDTTAGSPKTAKVRTWYNDSGPYSYFNGFAVFMVE